MEPTDLDVFNHKLRALIAETPREVVYEWERHNGILDYALSRTTTPYFYHSIFEVFEAHDSTPFEYGILIDIYNPRSCKVSRRGSTYTYEVDSIDNTDANVKWTRVNCNTGETTILKVDLVVGPDTWMLIGIETRS